MVTVGMHDTGSGIHPDDLLGGCIECRSEYGKGSTFTLQLFEE
jgi:chemotaxis protein histidine kinase CheA